MFMICVEEKLLNEAKVSREVIEFILNTLETRIVNEKRTHFFLHSTQINVGFLLKKEMINNKVSITINEIIPGDMYLHTGMLTQELQEFIDKLKK